MQTDEESVPETHEPAGGRPGHDWEALYAAWRASGMTKAKFLRSQGFSYAGGTVAVNTRRWIGRLRADMLAATAQYTAAIGKGSVVGCSSDDQDGFLTATGTNPERQGGRWEAITRLRCEQALADWGDADRVRSSIREILECSLGTGTGSEQVSTLQPSQLRQLAVALGEIQRIQRLALGMSTENLGIDQPAPPAQTNIERPKDAEVEIPTFIVEMSSRGRFLRPRPRRIS